MLTSHSERGIHSVRTAQRQVYDQQIHMPLPQLGRQVFNSDDFMSAIAAAIEQPADEIADGEIVSQNQNGLRAGHTGRLGREGSRFPPRERLGLVVRRVDQAQVNNYRASGVGFKRTRLERIERMELAWHHQERSAGRIHRSRGGLPQGNLPEPEESHPADAAAEGREEEASEKDIEGATAHGAADVMGATPGTQSMGDCSCADSPHQRAKNPFGSSDIWNTRHGSAKLGRGLP